MILDSRPMTPFAVDARRTSTSLVSRGIAARVPVTRTRVAAMRGAIGCGSRRLPNTGTATGRHTGWHGVQVGLATQPSAMANQRRRAQPG